MSKTYMYIDATLHKANTGDDEDGGKPTKVNTRIHNSAFNAIRTSRH